MLLTKLKLAELAGCGKAGVSMALRRGKLAETAEGKIDLEDPRNTAWIVHRAGLDEGAALHDALEAAALESAPTNEPADAPTAQGEALRVKPEEDSFLELEADFGDGLGWVRVIRHRFDEYDSELDSYLFPIPHPIRIDYDGPTIFDLTTGAAIPTRIAGLALERAMEVRA